ncbi:hypothetical protein EV426DRAFT_674072 [Tirmania nivea]|nr:hypothetical protein EV426DRAFT_674072 [Tirmania nivea]
MCKLQLQHLRPERGASRKFGTITTGKEAKRLHFICPILNFVSDWCGADIKILVEESMPGGNIHVDVQFEFIIEWKGKRVYIVEANKDDMEQGMVQNLLGCEAVADIQSLNCVYGIVTISIGIFTKASMIILSKRRRRFLYREVEKSDQRQAIMQIIVASTRSNYPVLALLTDLRETWLFYWLSLEGRQVGVIQECKLDLPCICGVLLAGCKINKKRRREEHSDYEPQQLYGIVTTSSQWVFIRLEEKPGTDPKDPVTVHVEVHKRHQSQFA